MAADQIKRTVTLCGTQGCCPTLEILKDRSIVIKDDHGGTVKLNEGEWKDLLKQMTPEL